MIKRGRPKGGTNKYWRKEDKFIIIKPVINGEIGRREAIKQVGISSSQMHNWIRAYDERGIKGLENKCKQGNPFVRFQAKNNLTELEKLQYENMKLRIANERLK